MSSRFHLVFTSRLLNSNVSWQFAPGRPASLEPLPLYLVELIGARLLLMHSQVGSTARVRAAGEVENRFPLPFEKGGASIDGRTAGQ